MPLPKCLLDTGFLRPAAAGCIKIVQFLFGYAEKCQVTENLEGIFIFVKLPLYKFGHPTTYLQNVF